MVLIRDLSGSSREVSASHAWSFRDLAQAAALAFGLPPTTRCCLFYQGKRVPDATVWGCLALSPSDSLTLIALRSRSKSKHSAPLAFSMQALEEVSPCPQGDPLPLSSARALFLGEVASHPARSFNPSVGAEEATAAYPCIRTHALADTGSAVDGVTSQGGAQEQSRPGEDGPAETALLAKAHPQQVDHTCGTELNSGRGSAQHAGSQGGAQKTGGRARTRGNGAAVAPVEDPLEGPGRDKGRGRRGKRGPGRVGSAARDDSGQGGLRSKGGDSEGDRAPGNIKPTAQVPDALHVAQGASTGDFSTHAVKHPKASLAAAAETEAEMPAGRERQKEWFSLPPASEVKGPPLPVALAKVETDFGVLSTVCGFLQGQMVHATWRRVREGMQGMCPSSRGITLQSVRDMAILAPHVVALIHPSTDHSQPLQQAPVGPGPPGPREVSDDRAGSESHCNGTGLGAQHSHPCHGNQVHSLTAEAKPGGSGACTSAGEAKLIRDASTGERGEAPEDDIIIWMVESPSLAQRAAEGLQEQLNSTPEEVEAQALDSTVRQGPAGAGQALPGGEGACAPSHPRGVCMRWEYSAGGVRLTTGAVQNRVRRRAATFHSALVHCAQRVHADWLRQAGVCVEEGEKHLQAGHWHPLVPLSDLPLSIFLCEAQARESHLPSAPHSRAAKGEARVSKGKRGGTGGATQEAGGQGPKRRAKSTRAAVNTDCPQGAKDFGPEVTRKPAEGVGGAQGAADGETSPVQERGEAGLEQEAAELLGDEGKHRLQGRRHCSSTQDMSAEEMLRHLRQGLGRGGQIVHCQSLKCRKAQYQRVRHPLSPATLQVLRSIGIQRLYRHQALAIDAAMSGQHVVISTPTASGKSLCYNIPVLDLHQTSPESCALFLFPTKALAQDQLRALQVLTAALSEPPRVAIYDGDTPFSARGGIRSEANIVLTNPDMLHLSILPHHKDFARMLANLRYVVLDEAHSYNGAFGCHTAVILRRLRRICHHVYGRDPTFIVCSATCANAPDHSTSLVGVSGWCSVGASEDGSPCGDKTFVLWNPPVLQTPKRQSMRKSKTRQTPAARDPSPQTLTKRSSPIVEVALLLAEMVQHNLRCLAFCKTRKLSELVLSYTQDMLRQRCPHLVNSVVAYRSGYTAEDRRKIESELFGGSLRAVAATNALELGVDIGSLDATLHLGFQGTVASLWQQAGRAGRREKASLSVYVAFGCPMDQYFMAQPERLFTRPIEAARLDPNNPEVIKQQLACAAAELPILVEKDAAFFFGLGPAQGDPALGCSMKAAPGANLSPNEHHAGRVPPAGREAHACDEPRKTRLEIGAEGTLGRSNPCSRSADAEGEVQESWPHRVKAGDAWMEPCAGTGDPGPGVPTIAPSHETLHLGSAAKMQAVVKHLAGQGVLGRSPTDGHVDESWRYIGPQVKIWQSVKIRAIDPNCFAVVDDHTGELLEEIEEKKSFFAIHEGAVYMQQGRTYVVISLDLQRREARCRRANVKYWTSVIDITTVLLEGGILLYDPVPPATAKADGPRLGSSAQWSGCVICIAYPGYRKVWRGSNIPFDRVDLSLPQVTFSTQACWVRVPVGARDAVAQGTDGSADFSASLHAAAHAVINMLPAHIACNAADVGCECKHPQDTRSFPDRILLFDRHTGGIGLATQICEVFGELLLAAAKVVSSCPCEEESGCPGCVQTAGCSSYNNVLNKFGGRLILEEVIRAESLASA